jgi:hypothetical protein
MIWAMLSQQDAELIGAGITAVVTAFGVGAAIWIALKADDIRARRRAPVLTVSIVRNQHDVGLRVENATNRETARNVEVVVIDVEHHPARALEMPPKFADTVDRVNESLRWSDGSIRIDIHPGLRRDLRVGAVIGVLGPPENAPVFRAELPSGDHDLALTVAEPDRSNFPVPHFPENMQNAPARLRLAVIADNVNAAYYTLEVGWPWDLPWFPMAAIGAHTTRLLLGHAERSGDPHALAGGPWGKAAMDDLHRRGFEEAGQEPTAAAAADSESGAASEGEQ